MVRFTRASQKFLKQHTKKHKMNTELINNVRQWFHDKGIIQNSNPLKQLEKTQEELTETRDAFIRYDCLIKYGHEDFENMGQAIHSEIKDGIGDTLVTLIGVCEMYGVALEECLQQAYDVISKRTGRMENGVFVKDKEVEQ